MAGLPKKYFKMFPGNLKKGWAAFRAERGTPKKKKSGAKKKHVHHAKKKTHAVTTAKHGGGKMAKKKKSVSHKVRRAGRRFAAAAGTRPGQVLIMAGTAAAGGVATSFAINNIPKVKELSAMNKSLIQGGLGIAAVLFGGKRKWVKGLGAGSVIAAVFGLSKSVLNLNPLAGPGAGSPTLSPSQMARITGMNAPANVRMNLPASVRMNTPANVRMRGNAPVSGWTQGGWGNNW
jgi:hypothetical protein